MVVFHVSIALAPLPTTVIRTNLVFILDQVLALRQRQRRRERCAVLNIAGGEDGHVGEVGLEEVVARQHRGIPAGQLDEDEADEAGNGEEHGREDARYPPACTHRCGRRVV